MFLVFLGVLGSSWLALRNKYHEDTKTQRNTKGLHKAVVEPAKFLYHTYIQIGLGDLCVKHPKKIGVTWKVRCSAFALAALVLGLVAALGQELQLPPPAARPVDFVKDVEPILKTRCVSCHGTAMQMSGLRLDERQAALAGGYSGPVIKPGDGAGSRLLKLVAGVLPVRMPMSGAPLTADEVGLLRAWIDQGAQWPQDRPAQTEAPAPSRPGHWAFAPPSRPAVPSVVRRNWVRNPIDAFILARLEREGIEPSPEADRVTLLRRLSFDLIGLPPTPEELEAFMGDNRPDAYEREVDRMLASAHFGERWALPWLDLAHYADSDGFNDAPPALRLALPRTG